MILTQIIGQPVWHYCLWPFRKKKKNLSFERAKTLKSSNCCCVQAEAFSKFHSMNIQSGNQVMKASSLMTIGLDSKHIPKDVTSSTMMASKVMGESSTSICFSGDFSFTFSTSINRHPHIYFIDTQVKLRKFILESQCFWVSLGFC